MRRVPRQDIDLASLYLQCKDAKRSPAVRARLEISQAIVINAAQRYRTLGQSAQIFQFTQPQIPGNSATKRDMVSLYDSGLAKKAGVGRWAYDRIKTAAHLGICPLCGQRAVGTLDHYLPKESLWILAISPDNLIPSCSDCNFAKSRFCAQNAGEQPFHPYFDDADDSQWLFARLERANGLSVTFYVQDVGAWSPEKRERARNHFRIFRLNALYTTQAAEELVNIRTRLSTLHGVGGKEAVQSHLQEEAVSRRSNHLNSWQTALYAALAQDEQFCEGDFNDI